MDDLVSAAWLAAHLADADVLVLDASAHLPATGRDARAEYLVAHIPGTRFLDLASLTDAASPVPAALPTGEQVARRLATLGYRAGMRLVLYDDSDVKTAARAWFALRRAGLTRVALLDGGLGTWRADGGALQAGETPVETAAAEHLATAAARVRSKHDMLANLDTRAEQVIDARDAARFTGASADTVHGLPGGHIPGARNLFFRDLFGPDGTFLPPERLRDAFVQAGVDLARPIVTSCGSGVTASVLLFALHLIGVEDAALYDGSWSEWGADPATPKATGAA